MARSNLRNLRVQLTRDTTTQQPVVQVAFDFDSTDGDALSRTRDVTARLSEAQRTTVSNMLAAIESAVRGAEAIA